MPLYNVEHSFPLNVQQKQDLAERITRLHGTAFATLSVFVQVKFYQQDASAQNHYVGGVPQEQASNRITAFVRSSSSRSQEDFDKLAKKVEDAWYIVLGLKSDEDEEDEKDKKDKNDKKEVSATEKAAKELLSVVYIGGLSGREKGFEIPVAGKESSWFQQNRDEFEKRADLGDESLKGLLEEVEKREDLKSWRS